MPRSISILIPWRDPRDGSERFKAADYVARRWKHQYPDAQIVFGDHDPTKPFNRAVARNAAFAQSFGDLVIISDADTITEKENVEEAISLLERGAPWVIAHRVYYSLTNECSQSIMSRPVYERIPSRIEYHWKMERKSEAGVLVMPRDAFVGYNAYFQGWGYEDNEFAARTNGFVGNAERTNGAVYHLWHERGDADFDQPHIEANKLLYDKTKAKYG